MLQPSIQSLTHILLGTLLAHVAHQILSKLRLSAHETGAWKILLEKELAMCAKEDASAVVVDLNSLRERVRNLQGEKEELGKEVHRLMRTKEYMEQRVFEQEAELLELERRRGGEMGGLGLASSAGPKAGLQTRGQYEGVDGASNTQPWEKKRDTRALEALHRELEDKYSEALRQLRKAQAASCLTCSLRNPIFAPLTFSIGIFDHDDSFDWSDSPLTRSCHVPSPSPPNPDRHRRRITMHDSPGGEGESNVVEGNGDVNLCDSILSVVDHVPSPDLSEDGLEDYHFVTPRGVSDIGDFFFPDSYVDIEYFGSVDPWSDPVV